MGSSSHTVALPTALVEDRQAKINLAQEAGHEYYKFQMLRVVLSHRGRPLSDASITFTVAGHVVCVGVTDTHGRASCDNSAKFAVELFDGDHPPTAYTADFAGAGALQPSRTTGSLRIIGDGEAGEDKAGSPGGGA